MAKTKTAKVTDGAHEANDQYYVVEAIIDHKGSGKSSQYLIKWEGYEQSENSWETASSLRRDMTASSLNALIATYMEENSIAKGKNEGKKAPAATKKAPTASKKATTPTKKAPAATGAVGAADEAGPASTVFEAQVSAAAVVVASALVEEAPAAVPEAAAQSPSPKRPAKKPAAAVASKSPPVPKSAGVTKKAGASSAKKTKAVAKAAERFIVESIQGHKGAGNGLYYKVRWEGYTAKDDTWQLASILRSDLGPSTFNPMVKDYEKRVKK